MRRVVYPTLELSARETRAVRVALVEARRSGHVVAAHAIVASGQGRLRVDAATVEPICRLLTHVAREIPAREMPARLGIGRAELDALFARVVARWARLAGL